MECDIENLHGRAPVSSASPLGTSGVLSFLVIIVILQHNERVAKDICRDTAWRNQEVSENGCHPGTSHSSRGHIYWPLVSATAHASPTRGVYSSAKGMYVCT